MKSLTEKITCPLNRPREEREAGSPPHPSRGGREGGGRPGGSQNGKELMAIISVLASPQQLHIGSFPSPLRLIACRVTLAPRTPVRTVVPCTGG